jgi:tetratricopeptide (TPR) repeat protein
MTFAIRPSIQRILTRRAYEPWRSGWPVLALLTMAAQACGIGSNAPPLRDVVSDLATVQTPATTAAGGTLRAAGDLFAATNAAPFTNSAPKPAEEFRAHLEIARHHRLARQFAEASMVYGWVLENGAPESLQRTVLLELAEMAQENNDWARAQQIYAQWVARWPQDVRVPEIILYQGLVYRRMGLNNLAIAKLYAVMTSALVIKSDRFDYYQQLVLRAQNEIAETQYELGNFAEAVESFSRLLKLEPPPVNRSFLQYRYLHCLTELGRRSETIAQAQDFLERYPDDPERPEVHFVCATALKAAHRETEALQQVLALLQEQCRRTNCTAQSLAYWQRRAGNAIANQFYQEGDPLKALEIYERLAALDTTPQWQLPVWYQVGLVFERLGQPAKAIEYYGNIMAREKEVSGAASPSLKTVIEMANWRKDFLGWQIKAEQATLGLRAASFGPAVAAKPSPPTP